VFRKFSFANAMRPRNFFSLNKCASKFFILLFTINQFIVFYMIWEQFVVNKETLNLDEISTSTSENGTSTTELPSTTGRYTMIYDEKRRNHNQFYIYFATNTTRTPLWELKKDFINNDDLKSVDCPYTNCEASVMSWSNKDFSVLDFDAIVFNPYYEDINLPKIRTPRQQYIMCSNE
jgi:hypothetical protein